MGDHSNHDKVKADIFTIVIEASAMRRQNGSKSNPVIMDGKPSFAGPGNAENDGPIRGWFVRAK
jgi:hypothetical protein